MGEILKSKPGAATRENVPEIAEGVVPVLHCSQEIPCNPCTSVCPQKLIRIDGADIRRLPQYVGSPGGATCVGCDRCVAICPGLAITLVDFRKDRELPTVTIPMEFGESRPRVGEQVAVRGGELVG